jgi:predicted lysophospholipase L1 biosynthesis ABC-type transport system permease subunit
LRERKGATAIVKSLGQHRQWLKRNVNTQAGTVAVLGGLCLGSLLCVCWAPLLLWLALPADPTRLQAEAFAEGLSATLMGAYAGAAAIFHPGTAYTPTRPVIVGVVPTSADYVVAISTIAELLSR